MKMKRKIVAIVSITVVAGGILALAYQQQAYANVSAGSSNTDIQRALCGSSASPSSGDTACYADVEQALRACDVNQPNNVGNITWRSCRERVISENQDRDSTGSTSRPPGSSDLGAIPSATSGDIMGDCEQRPLTRENCGIINMVWIITDALAVLVSVVVVMTIVIGGIEYSAAGANPQAVIRAKKHITRALLAVAAFLFTYTIFEWLVPGGRFFL